MPDENTPEAEALRSSQRAQEAATAASDAAKEARSAVERIVQPTANEDDGEGNREATDQVRRKEEEEAEAPAHAISVHTVTEGNVTGGFISGSAALGKVRKEEIGSTSPDRHLTGSDSIEEGGEGEGRV